jgi:Cell wall-associated hydrolases (invasion-associated proteins)
MSRGVGKLAAMAATGCLVATIALPMYAAAEPEPSATSSSASGQSLQLLVSWASADPAAPARDNYSVTLAAPPPPVVRPRPVAAVAASRYTTVKPPNQAYSGAAVLAYAAQFVGVVPYGPGNSPTTSFSCDGYTQYVFAGFGISLPRTADRQAALGVRIAKADARAGDLVWWPGRHVGIYDGAGGMYNSPAYPRYVEHVGSLWGDPVFIRL